MRYRSAKELAEKARAEKTERAQEVMRLLAAHCEKCRVAGSKRAVMKLDDGSRDRSLCFDCATSLGLGSEFMEVSARKKIEREAAALQPEPKPVEKPKQFGQWS